MKTWSGIFISIAFVVISAAPALCQSLAISDVLTLRDVFDAGFRPSHMGEGGTGLIRQWDTKKVGLRFDGYNLDLNADHFTFSVYDDDQVRRLDVYNASRPLTFDEGVAAADAILKALGMQDRQLIQWREEVVAGGRMRSFGTNQPWKEGVRVGIELLSSFQELEERPIILSVSVSWDYRGSGPYGGGRMKPVTTPSGYDWDMSFKAWTERQRGRKNGPTGLARNSAELEQEDRKSQTKVPGSIQGLSGRKLTLFLFIAVCLVAGASVGWKIWSRKHNT